MDEYIKREAVIEAIMSEPPDAHYPQWYVDKIKSIPAADVAEVRRGRWIEEDGIQICSECGEEHEWEDYRAPYCDTCGAKMAEKAVKEEACQNGGN